MIVAVIFEYTEIKTEILQMFPSLKQSNFIFYFLH